jgi:hypothetical protein
VYVTDALMDQKLASMTPELAWWFEILRRGYLPGDIGYGATPNQVVYEDYVSNVRMVGGSHRSNGTLLGKFLRKYAPGVRTVDREVFLVWRGPRPDGHDHRDYRRVYVFPSLAECRAAFEKACLGLPADVWANGPAEWRTDPRLVAGDPCLTPTEKRDAFTSETTADKFKGGTPASETDLLNKISRVLGTGGAYN